jgi:hypothetical protein
MTNFQELGHADRSLQGVLKIVIAQVVFLIVWMSAHEQVGDIGEQRIQQLGCFARKHRLKAVLYVVRDASRILGIDRRGHNSVNRRAIELRWVSPDTSKCSHAILAKLKLG